MWDLATLARKNDEACRKYWQQVHSSNPLPPYNADNIIRVNGAGYEVDAQEVDGALVTAETVAVKEAIAARANAIADALTETAYTARVTAQTATAAAGRARELACDLSRVAAMATEKLAMAQRAAEANSR